MGATIARVVGAMCAGRSRQDVLERLALTAATGMALWLFACVFMVLESAS